MTSIAAIGKPIDVWARHDCATQSDANVVGANMPAATGAHVDMKWILFITTLLAAGVAGTARAQAPIDWKAVEAETLRHFQALVRIDTSNPPGNETRAVEYLKQVLDKEGIPYQVFAGDANRANLVARIKGNGKKKPILVMGHTDVVTIDPKKWIDHGPFSADVAGGYVYGRGTVDDKDNLAASLMLVLMLKRSNAALDRDVIFLAESGEEGSPEVGAQFMIDQHFDAIDAEYCLAEGGGVARTGGKNTQRQHQHHREGAARRRDHRARAGRPRLGAAPDQRRRAPVERGGEDRRVDAAAAGQRDHRLRISASSRRRRLARGGEALSRRAEPGPEGVEAGRRLDARERAGALVDAAHLGRADDSHRRLPLQRDPVGSQGDARRAAAPGRGPVERSSTRSARSSTTRASRFAGRATATVRPAPRA